MIKRSILASLFVVLLLAGCGGSAAPPDVLSGQTTDVVTATPTPTPQPSPASLREQVLAAFYPPADAAQMRFDAAAIGARYDGTPFSTSQYAQCMIEGTADVKDVFDARIPSNYAVLQRYASGDNPAHVSYLLEGGLYAYPNSQYIYRYARAAVHFMEDFQYDAIVFHPDEYQAVLTRDNDTWMFIRDYDPRIPTVPVGTRFYSKRVVTRSLTMMGSYNVAAETRRAPMTQCPLPIPLIEFYYVPASADGLGYTPYATLTDTPVSDLQDVGSAASQYVPVDATPATLQLRAQAGIIPSPDLSNRSGLPVGKWVQTRFASVQVSGQLGAREQGFSYTTQDDAQMTNTWSSYGNYVLPLDPAYGAAPTGTRPVVSALDHVVLQSADPQGLFTILTDTLGLPPAWPYVHTQSFDSGGVQVGNANLETLGPHVGTTSIYGLVYQPCGMDKVVGDLQARGAAPGPVTVQRGPAGEPLWRNAMLSGLFGPSYIVYLCEYAPGPRAAMAGRKKPAPLGGAGIVALSEVVMTSPTPEDTKRRWSVAMAPLAFDTYGVMRCSSSPALRVVQGSENRLRTLVLRVASLSKARQFLQQRGLLGSDSGTELTIDPTRVQGLDLRLVE